MTKKPNMTVTGRHLDELPPIAVKQTRSPYPNPPPNREAIGRLTFQGPTPKLDWSPAELAEKIRVCALQDALILPDTNVFTRELDPLIWDAFRTRCVLITSRVFKELQPWLNSPFQNKSIRNDVVAELKKKTGAPEGRLPRENGVIDILLADEDAAYEALGYQYYCKLLALRKLIGPLSLGALKKQLGREPTEQELSGFVQRQFGPRGLLLAKKGLEGSHSENVLTDENLVVIAVLTAIMRGSEVFIVTRDADVLEQYFKLLCLMKEHYRAMLVAKQYAADAKSSPFVSVPTPADAQGNRQFTDESVLQLVTTDNGFDPLPAKFQFVNVYCILMGGDTKTLKITWCNFCAETQIADMLRIKAATGGLSTDKFGGRNCTIRTETLEPENYRVIVSIGNEPTLQFGPFGGFYLSDVNNVLCPNEMHTQVCYR
jgi:hypothetical protein